MLRDAKGFKHIYIACGRTDLRKGQDSLLMIIRNEFDLNPFESGNLFLFCGRRCRVIKAILFEEDGFVVLTKRLIRGRYQWPMSKKDVLDITQEQYHLLMEGFSIEYTSTIERVKQLYI